MNYIQVERKLKDIGDSHAKRVNYIFGGTNLVTQSKAGVWKDSSTGIYFELSYGRGMGDYYIYGVTFKDKNGKTMHNESKCCHKFSDVESTIESVLYPIELDKTQTESK